MITGMKHHLYKTVIGMSVLVSAAIGVYGAPVSPLSSISVTNHAGRVVSGEFGGVTNGNFLVSGRAYPLSALPKDEQLRVKKLAGLDMRTAKEKRLDRARELRLERICLREAEGEIDRSTADRLRRDLGPERK